MEKLQYLLCCALLFLSDFTPLSHADDMCVQKSPCVCEFSNGTGIDLSNSSKPIFHETQMFENSGGKLSLTTYYFHPCFDKMPVISNSSANGNNSCNKPLTLYRESFDYKYVNGSYINTENLCEFLGNISTSVFSNYSISIIQKNGPSNTVVKLVCADIDDKLGFDSNEDPKNISLTFYSRNACLRQIEDIDNGRSTGSTLLIIFFSMVIFYLVLGVCTKKFLMGATGIEVVPNLAFWSDLPNLIKDGWSFAISGFKLPPRGAGPSTSPDPNSYDSI